MSVIVVMARRLTISPAEIPRIGRNALFLFAACEAHDFLRVVIRLVQAVVLQDEIFGVTNHSKLLTPLLSISFCPSERVNSIHK